MADEKTAITILNDDTFSNELGKIIERDFFPEMPELRYFLTDSHNSPKDGKRLKNASLNCFLNNYVSEENFHMNAKIRQDNEEKHKQRFKWLYEQQKSTRFNALMFNQTPSIVYNKKSVIGIRHKNARSIKFNSAKLQMKKRVENLEPCNVRTPDIVPGVDDTPVLTWGNVDATPMLIENHDDDNNDKIVP